MYATVLGTICVLAFAGYWGFVWHHGK